MNMRAVANIARIALKEIKTGFRHKQTFLFMLLFPILLMLILGTALTNAFSGDLRVGEMKLLYRDSSANPELKAYWQSFADVMRQQGIELTALGDAQSGAGGVSGAGGTGAAGAKSGTDVPDGARAVADNEYTAYIELGDSGIRYYGSSVQTIESGVIQGMLTAFADRYNLAAAAFQTDPAGAEALLAQADDGRELVRESSLDPQKKPGALDYYAISITTMIALYASLPGSFLFRSERLRNTISRLIAAPIGKGQLFTGKVLGCAAINLITLLAVVLFSIAVYGANWSHHYGVVFLVLATEVVLAVSLGLGIGFLFKGDGARSSVMIFTQIASFTGGAYFPVDSAGGSFLGALPYISPLHWANTALLQVIYSDDLAAVWPAVGLNVGIAAIFLVAAAAIMHRREAV